MECLNSLSTIFVSIACIINSCCLIWQVNELFKLKKISRELDRKIERMKDGILL